MLQIKFHGAILYLSILIILIFLFKDNPSYRKRIKVIYLPVSRSSPQFFSHFEQTILTYKYLGIDNVKYVHYDNDENGGC